MGKSNKGKHSPPQRHLHPRKKGIRLWQGLFTLVVLGGLTWTYVVLYRPAYQDTPSRPENTASPGVPSGQDTPSRPENTASSGAPSDEASLRNRLVLPATPRNPRPPTLDPGLFPDPQVAAAYQIARAIPEVLESIPCYCSCYQSAGHRNNLDCFVDNHGAT